MTIMSNRPKFHNYLLSLAVFWILPPIVEYVLRLIFSQFSDNSTYALIACSIAALVGAAAGVHLSMLSLGFSSFKFVAVNCVIISVLNLVSGLLIAASIFDGVPSLVAFAFYAWKAFDIFGLARVEKMLIDAASHSGGDEA